MPNKITNTYFHLEKDLNGCTNSLLFDSDEGIAEAEFKDEHGNTVKEELIVTGEVSIVYKDTVYNTYSDFPADLVDIIRANNEWDNEDVFINANNWFELVYTVENANGEEVGYDGFVFEPDLSKMTPDELKAKLTEYAESLFDDFEKELKGSSVINTLFDCEKDLSKYTHSMLFADGKIPAVADFKDSEGNTINLKLIVTGEVWVEYKDKVYHSSADFPNELIDLIKSGQADEGHGARITSNNWVELVYSVCDIAGNEVAFDGETFESELSKMTPSELKAELTDYAEYLFSSYENELKESNSAKDKTQHQIYHDKSAIERD